MLMDGVCAFIPARSGSKGVRHKNIKILGGASLLQWSIQAAKMSKRIERIIVSTDSEDYANLAIECGAEVPCIRPKELSTDQSTDFEFFWHMLSFLKEHDSLPEYVAHLRPTTPFREATVIDSAINLFMASPVFTSLRSVHTMSESAYKTFERNESGTLMSAFTHQQALDASNNARQSFPDTFVANGYVDLISVKFVFEEHLLHGDCVFGYETDFSPEVDVETDFDYLEFLLSKNSQLKNRLFME